MGIAGGIVVFVITWWLCFFIALPFGVRSQLEEGDTTPGTEAGAPANPQLLKKALWASVGAGVLTVIVGLTIPQLLAQ